MLENIKTKTFTCEIVRRDRRRTASLQVSPANKVSIIVPKDLPEDKVSHIVRKKTAWILAKMKFNNEVKYPHKAKEFVSGESITYLGRNYRLKVVSGKTEQVQLKNGRFLVTISGNAEDTESQAKQLLTDWFIVHAEAKLSERVQRFDKRIGATYSGIKVKSLKQRWGSCTKDGVLNFNWRIAIAPISIVDYVVAHELCHRIHHDHSKEFWKLLARVMPDYQERKEWLRVNGAMLEI